MLNLVLMLAMTMQAVGGDAFTRLHDEWAHNLHEKRVAALVAEFAADGEFIQPDGQRVKGPEALKQLFERITKTFDSDLKFTSVRVEVSGELAYDSGTYRETLITRATGKHQEWTGSYLTIYRKSRDGGWLIAEQVWTGAPIEDVAH